MYAGISIPGTGLRGMGIFGASPWPHIVRRTDRELLPIYLQDHFAGATAGADLARRAAHSNRDSEGYNAPLRELAREIDEDRDSLRSLMGQLHVRIDPVKALAAWTGEKMGRLKLNGRLFTYSPLSRLEEVELLALGVTGKRALWRTLHLLAAQQPHLSARELEHLIGRADEQLEKIEACRRRAVLDALAECAGENASPPALGTSQRG
jgi:hypothetical protein